MTRIRYFLRWAAFMAPILWAVTLKPAGSEPLASRPKLVLVLSVDQLRADYLVRFNDLFDPPLREENGHPSYGGFRFLQQRGAWFVDARHDHYPLLTGPGHAVQLSGAHPYKSGIVGNYWFDPEEKHARRYCVEDLSPRGQLIGTQGDFKKTPGISPVPLLVSTVGDELRMATGNRARVWGLALKDRAAVLMAGHLANGAIWFNEDSGDWISSRYYFTNGHLPRWLVNVNTSARSGATRLVDTFTNVVWRFSFASAADRLWAQAREFSHSQNSTNYKDFTFTPSANEFVLQTARVLIEHEQLGADAVPDLLAINFSSNDYVGHKHGPDSAEVLDITVQTDRQLGRFFTWLDARIGLTNVIIVLSSDHGVSPHPARMRQVGHFDAAAVNERAMETELNRQLKDWYGFRPGRTNAAELIEYNLYIHTDALRTRASPAKIRERVANALLGTKHFGLYAAYTRDRILSGQLPRTDICTRVMNGFHPDHSGDIVLVPKSFSVHVDPKNPYITSHGSPYVYDTSVPLLLCGPGIKQIQYLQPVSTLDIAPTLAYLLHILPPSGCEGKILEAAINRSNR